MSRSLISKKNAIENERPQTPFVWPAKCHSIGVIEIAKFDVTAQAQGGSRGAAVLQTGGDSQPLFSDSLFAATTVSAKKVQCGARCFRWSVDDRIAASGYASASHTAPAGAEDRSGHHAIAGVQ
jgi:hypothetical protein